MGITKKKYRETFVKNYTNAAQFDAGSIIAFEDRVNAERNNNIPHNQMTIADNQGSGTDATYFIFLDNANDTTKPDYILFPNERMTLSFEEGATWTTIFIKNTHATDNVAAESLKIRVSTVKEVA